MAHYESELAALQQRVPIGARHGLAVLQATAGDVAQAALRIQHELTGVVARQADVPAAEARQALAQHGFHVARALDFLDQQRHSLTERLLRRYKKPDEAIGEVARAVAQAYQVPFGRWVFWDLDAAQRLPPVPRCVLTVSGWLDYESFEPLEAALYFHLDAVLACLREPLRLPQVGQTLRRLRQLENARRRRPSRTRKRWPRPAFEAAEAAFDRQRPLVVEALYALITASLALLP